MNLKIGCVGIFWVAMPQGSGLDVTLNYAKLAKYRFKIKKAA